jgi:hypothetical protein
VICPPFPLLCFAVLLFCCFSSACHSPPYRSLVLAPSFAFAFHSTNLLLSLIGAQRGGHTDDAISGSEEEKTFRHTAHNSRVDAAAAAAAAAAGLGPPAFASADLAAALVGGLGSSSMGVGGGAVEK